MVKASTNAVVDGEYFMQIGTDCDKRVRLHCRGMNTDYPSEYISLVSGQIENYAYVHDYKQPYASKEDCVKANGKEMSYVAILDSIGMISKWKIEETERKGEDLFAR